MSSFPARSVEIWKSSLANSMSPISGVFSFEVMHTVMVPQTLQFLAELAARQLPANGIAASVLKGMYYSNLNKPGSLLLWRPFKDADELFAFDIQMLSDAIRQIELHFDINLTYRRVQYLADVGAGPTLPLLILTRLPFGRGVAFEVQERGLATQSIQLGDFQLSEKVRVAQQHYSTGMSLMAGEDAIAGLIDAAFLQFYLAIEATLESHKCKEALQNGQRIYKYAFDEAVKRIVSHVYLARHRFFGHANPKFIKGLLDTETAFDIAKQTLVARWCARKLLEFELKRPLLMREMRLYPEPRHSVEFNGEITSLDKEFALPS